MKFLNTFGDDSLTGSSGQLNWYWFCLPYSAYTFVLQPLLALSPHFPVWANVFGDSFSLITNVYRREGWHLIPCLWFFFWGGCWWEEPLTLQFRLNQCVCSAILNCLETLCFRVYSKLFSESCDFLLGCLAQWWESERR